MFWLNGLTASVLSSFQPIASANFYIYAISFDMKW